MYRYTNDTESEVSLIGGSYGGSLWASLAVAVIDGLDELHGSGELHPPIALFPAEAAGVEVIDVLHRGEQAGRVSLGRGSGLLPARVCLCVCVCVCVRA